MAGPSTTITRDQLYEAVWSKPLKSLAEEWNTTYLRLVEVYRSINYRDDARDACSTLYQKYPGDREVRSVCGPPEITRWAHNAPNRRLSVRMTPRTTPA